MTRIYDKWLLAAAGVAVALMAVNIGISYRNARELREHGDWVIHTHEVMSAIEHVMSLIEEAEAAQRGYLITGEQEYLTPYHRAVAAIGPEVDRLEEQTRDNAEQQAEFPGLRAALRSRLATLENNIELRAGEDVDEAKASDRLGLGREQMLAVRSVITNMLNHERQLLLDRSRQADDSYHTTVATNLLSGLSALAAVGVLLVSVRRSLNARQRAAAALSRERELLQTTLASIGDAVITTDGEARITYLNGIARQLTGWSQPEAAGQPLDVVFNIINEQTRHRVENPAVRSLRDGVVVGLANHTVLISKDGSEIPIDDSAAPIRDKAGHVAGCVLVFRDVTARREAETALRESEAKYRTLIEQVRDYAIYRIDAVGRATTWNEGVRAVLGYEQDEFIGRDVAALIFTPEDIEHGVPRRELEAAATTGTVHAERWMKKKDGTLFWAAGVTECLRDDTGRLIGFTKVKRDRTEAKRLEDELRQFAAELSEADRRKNEFLAMLAHELRNPLVPIRNALEIMRRSGGSAEQVEAATQMMQRQVAQMVRLIDDLLDVSRISRGAISLQMDSVELASIVNHVVDAVRPSIEAKEQRLLVELPEASIYLHADPTRLQQIVGNLLNNANKFTGRGGRIRLSAAVEGQQAVLRVEDSGIGIAADQLPKIFDMFTQANTSLERSESGLGIGLTLVKRLAELHGGTVDAASAGLGGGSVFTVRLPLSGAPAAAAAAPPSDDGDHRTVSGRRILVVDDNRDAAQSLAVLLKLAKNEVRLAFDGEEALAVAAQWRPEVVLLDIGLPKLNGFEVARRVRQLPWGASPVLVALTGWGQDEDRLQSRDAGFDGHLVKPVEHSALMYLLAESLPPT
jgi:PAS domain S-box-containing protein